MAMKLLRRTAWAPSASACSSACSASTSTSTSNTTSRSLSYSSSRRQDDARPLFRMVPSSRTNIMRSANEIKSGLQTDLTTRAGRPVGARTNHNYKLFESLVHTRLTLLLTQMGRWEASKQEYRSLGIGSQHELEREAGLFRQSIRSSFESAARRGLTSRRANPLFWNLRNAFVRSDSAGLTRELRYAFQTFVLRSRFPKAVTDLHHQLADLRFPYEWYPATRMMQRTVHLHVGPTNSGKTYNALRALEAAESGIYAGPLRLLAHEIYIRFTARGKRCALVTGEEQRFPEAGLDNSFFQSCTVEMSPLNRRVDVAVIDEIQMIADESRGWAWTQAFLGIQARELHLCGEERTVALIQALCARIGDRCVVHRYKRLNPLQTMSESLDGSFENLRKGDAVVSFSRIGLHSLKAGIESETGRRCAIVYGSLPPETRVQQAALFNEPDNDYDFLVASDAIGMGLNLEIKRVIFESAQKFDGMALRNLSVPEIKQIGGRAGRYRTANQAVAGGANADQKLAPAAAPAAPAAATAAAGANWGTPGFVTTLDHEDLPSVRKAFDMEAEPIRTAGILPPAFVIEKFYSYFPPKTPFSFVLARLRELSRLSPLFGMCDLSDTLDVADVIEEFDMSIPDRCTFLNAPVSLREANQKRVLKAFARCVADMRGGHLLDIPPADLDLEILDVDRRDAATGAAGIPPQEYLMRLESLHKAITLYLWLSYRYQGVFPSQHLAFHVKSLVEAKITDYLDSLSFTDARRRQRREAARKMAEMRRKKEENLMGEGDHAAGGGEDGEEPASSLEGAGGAGGGGGGGVRREKEVSI